MPRLTEYLLKLATDSTALDEFRKHRDKKAAVDLQTYLIDTTGLTREQAEAIVSGDKRRVQDAVQDELRAESSHDELEAKGLAVTFYCAVNHIQGPPGE
jgi:hypothetical protein